MTYDLNRLGIDALNPMQQEMLEQCRRHKDVALASPTGSGKTLAYLLPLVSMLDAASDALQALVIVPSRELAIQTADTLRRLCPDCRCAACYGGRAAMEEHRTLRGMRPHVVIATPGRMLDHLQKENLIATQLKAFVIDEFDKCIELGFQNQVDAILAMLRHVSHSMVLSATLQDAQLGYLQGRAYQIVDYSVAPEEDTDRIRFFEVQSPVKDKLDTLYRLLCTLGHTTSIVFVNHRESVERIGDYLHKKHMSVALYHGKMEQRDRERTIYRFANGSCRVLVSTDLASRGLDIEAVDNIIHYHLPIDHEAYIHRNGRTARWDATGASYMILSPEETRPGYLPTEPETFTLPLHTPAPVEAAWITIYIGKGKKDKVNRIDVVGFLSKVGGLSREEIGRVDVLSGWGYAAVPRAGVDALLRRIKGQKIKGMKTIFAIAD